MLKPSLGNVKFNAVLSPRRRGIAVRDSTAVRVQRIACNHDLNLCSIVVAP